MSTITSTLEEALAAMARGELVVVVDDTGGAEEGHLVLAAERATPEAIAFMVRHTSGVVCIAMTGPRLDELWIPLMVSDRSGARGRAFTVSVDHRASTSTGISAADRTATIRALVDPTAVPDDFARPGHVFPLRSAAGGVLRRAGPTEAAVDLTRLAGLAPAGVLAEIVNSDGSTARRHDVAGFAAEHGFVTVAISDLVAHRLRREPLVRHCSSCTCGASGG